MNAKRGRLRLFLGGPPTPGRPRFAEPEAGGFLLLLLTFGGFGALSLALGQDRNWDLLNYHYYNAWAVLNHRYGVDIAPAQLQTFLNPALDLAIYGLMKGVSPRAGGFILGAVQGLNVVLCYAIARFSLASSLTPRTARLLAFLTGAAAALSPMYLFELGATYGDNLTSIAVLAAVLILVRACGSAAESALAASSVWIGLLLGIAAGLKLPNALFLVAGLITVGSMTGSSCRWKAIAKFGAGAALGIAIAAGPWMVSQCRRYENPIFPFFNRLFRSPYFPPVNWSDPRWPARSPLDLLRYPIAWVNGERISDEFGFRDLRWALILLLLALVSSGFIARWRGGRRACGDFSDSALTKARPRAAIVRFSLLAFPIWLFEFGYTRYLFPVELIAPLVVLALMDALWNVSEEVWPAEWKRNAISRATRFRLATAILILMTLFARPPSLSSARISWRDSWFGVETRLRELPEKSAVLLVTDRPLAFMLPFLPSNARYLRVQGNLQGNPGALSGTLLERELKDAIDASRQRLFVLAPVRLERSTIDLGALGSLSIQNACERIRTHVGEFRLCKATVSRSAEELPSVHPSLSASIDALLNRCGAKFGDRSVVGRSPSCSRALGST